MLTVGELKFTLDSLQKNYNKDLVSIVENISLRSSMTNSNYTSSTNFVKLNTDNILDGFPQSDKEQMLRVASSNIDATNFALESSNFELDDKQKNINLHLIAFYDKFVIAFACLLMFFIGAPLGAIIRKGGLGLPIVFAILIFIIFHFINTFGKKVAQQDELSPFLGCWMSSFVLTPLAIILTKRATDDKGFSISFDWITDIYNRFLPAKTEEESETQEELLLHNNLYNIDYIKVEELHKQYKIYSRITFFVYLILLGISFIGKPETIVSIIIVMVIAIIFYSALFKSQQLLDEIGTIMEKKVDLNLYLVLAAGFPFFILFYFYNRSYLKEVISEYTKSASS
jgi:lipopolysaccharide export system permease protein